MIQTLISTKLIYTMHIKEARAYSKSQMQSGLKMVEISVRVMYRRYRNIDNEICDNHTC